MTTQTLVTLTDDAWTEVSNGSANVTLATRDTESFFAMISTSQPPAGNDKDGAFEGSAGSPVGYSDLTGTDRVWAIANKDEVKVSVVKS